MPELWRIAGCVSAVVLCHCGMSSTPSNPCQPSEPDGVQGGSEVLDLSVSDTAFTPTILKAENLAAVTLTLTNTGTAPHGFSVACISTPSVGGCPPRSCFPSSSTIAPIAAGAHATTTFVAPNPEGIYTFNSPASGDSMTGQFIVQ